MAKGEDLSGFVRGFIIEARLAGASSIKTSQLAGVSVGTVAKGTRAFRAMEKTVVNRAGNFGQKCAFNKRKVCVLVRYVSKRAPVSQVLENINSICLQLQREGYSRVAVDK